jgi:fructose-1,6-bisphosphatase/inositol monophosphatase family enzyme
MAAFAQRDFASLLEPGVRRAAALARSLEGQVANLPKIHEASDTKQALTEADTRAQEILLETLYEHFPEVSLAAEEDTPSVARFAKGGPFQVVIDPIDGTLHSYLQGSGPYAVMIGLLVRDRYESGLVALPREGLLFAATRGQGALAARGSGPLRPVRPSADGNRILVSHGTPAEAIDYLEGQGYEVVPACGGAVAVAPLVRGVRAGLRVSMGAGIGISIRGRIGTLVAAEAGALLRSERDARFPLDATTRAATLRVAACEDDLALLLRALRAAGIP